jgi:hypothetical protein
MIASLIAISILAKHGKMTNQKDLINEIQHETIYSNQSLLENSKIKNLHINPKIDPLDSADCYEAYNDLIIALKGLSDERNKIPRLADDIAALYAAFKSECAATIVKSGCATLIGTIDTTTKPPVKTDAAKLEASCPVTPPPDSTDCYEAYNNLITALKGLSDERNKIPRLADDIATLYSAFKSKCATTVAKSGCATLIGTIDTTTKPPVKTDAAKLEASCSVTPPPDSADCYEAYNNLITALKGLSSRKNAIFELAEADIATLYSTFKSKCTTTVAKSDCATLIGTIDITTKPPVKTDAAKLEEKCLVTPPPDSADCYEAYNNLITALEALSRRKNAIFELAEADIATLYSTFKSKCAATIVKSDCATLIETIDATSKPPVKTDAAKLKDKCLVENLAPAGGGDDQNKGAGSSTRKINFALIAIILLLTRFYFSS